MRTSRTDRKSHAFAGELGDDLLSFAGTLRGMKPGIRARTRSEGENTLHACGMGMRLQAIELRIVGGKNGGAARLHAFENFGLGVGDGFQIAEIFEMGR